MPPKCLAVLSDEDVEISDATFGGITALQSVDRNSARGPWAIALCRWKLKERPAFVDESSVQGLLRIPLSKWPELEITYGYDIKVLEEDMRKAQEADMILRKAQEADMILRKAQEADMILRKAQEADMSLRKAQETACSQESTWSQETTYSGPWTRFVHWFFQLFKRLI